MSGIIDQIINKIRPQPQVKSQPIPDLSKVKVHNGVLDHALTPSEHSAAPHSKPMAIPANGPAEADTKASSVSSSLAALKPNSFTGRRSSVISALTGGDALYSFNNNNYAFASDSAVSDENGPSALSHQRTGSVGLNIREKLRRPSTGAIQQALDLT
ncbi:hypothetical protein BABINDRAFT_168854 [Babjeviella inositovora NRRL Y-12698]|uniref:Uncharacterized protein n=1 Tax=Babjeviella inositovora NRRL Y-12698 TaxID=984486 RepID=A0A1E3QJS0_9ASCO|nr:uncharacterized protein BABINDRAFT_168854 [Babjeviella inositovora NRRL Y-12698]ODQ77900.1 hypothetical protein BABINDRAFT_168854 [Babjeviella inositovora NRRL Y-12698]